jgi:serine/threonine protein kinase/tetratricopeptide (TPR) repeat protein
MGPAGSTSQSATRGCGLQAAVPTPASACAPGEALTARLIEEMTAAWRQGNCLSVEEFLARYPDLGDQPEAAVRLIYEELCLRQESGQEVTTAEVLRRFPQWQPQLEIFFDCYRLMQGRAAVPSFPQVGQVLGEFRLLAELDRGARGRVFLASQASLADRPLVLKITPCDGQEQLALARLQHTHIVPLYLVQDFPTRNLRVLCMPYLGGRTLLRLLQTLSTQPPERRTGQHVVDALNEAPVVAADAALPAQGPARKFLARASYVEAVCWIGACLADALQYAHERGLVHLDLKPSNVLLTADGQPMLLDFHLAREPIGPDKPAPEWLGGTPEYMSPEQRVAMAQVGGNEPISVVVDGRSDLYALGILLYEALCGNVPEQAAAPPRLDQRNPQVSVGLADMIQKCLAHDPDERYPDATDFATDLRRHLTDRPLCGVANRSLGERWRKWRRRRPHALALSGMFVGTLVVILIAAFAVESVRRQHHDQRVHEAERAAQTALVEGHDQLTNHQFEEAVRTLTRGQAQVKNLPSSRELAEALDVQLRTAMRARQAHDLHVVAERLRFSYDMDSLGRTAAQELEARSREVWGARSDLIESRGPELEPELEQRIRTDLLELAVLWTDLHARLAPGDEAVNARQQALQVLAEAEALFGPSHILYRERQSHAEALGRTEAAQEAARRASELAPRTAWEHYALGRFLFRSGDLESAASEYNRAIDLRPQDFWPHFYQGICAYRLHRFDQAVNAFQVCVALAPNCAECFYNLGLAHTALGHAAQALGDYDHALLLSPFLVDATLNRGILHYQEKRYAEALADFERALHDGADPAIVHYNLALVHLAQKDRTTAQTSLRRALQSRPDYREARELSDRLDRKH